MINPLLYYYSLRTYVDPYVGLIGRRFIGLVWVVAICILIWFYGYLLALGSFKPLEPEFNRLIAMVLVIAGFLGWTIWTTVRKRRAETAMLDDLAAEGTPSPDAEARAEVDTLRDRLKEALQLLRRVGKNRFGYIYEQPWYLIIGAPGSGKTTSLTHSGLKFPLGEVLGAEPVKGVGGTRNCTWWFAEDAILIDTAGRYTTHGNFAGADKAGWNGFLSLLHRHRPSQPINGALITLSIPDLLERDPETRLEEVRQIRQRLAEMDETLRARVPIYIVLTKADLLEGFVPFFDGLSRGGRDQVWGTTFPLDVSQDPTSLPERFLEEFDLLRSRIDDLLLERMQQEPDIEVRGRIFELPARMTALREPMREVLSELCSQSKLMAPPLLRGVYITSSTQNTASQGARGQRRSYFLLRLFSHVIFEEAALIARDKRLTGRALLLRRIAVGAVALIGATVLLGWIGAYFHNINAISRAETEISNFQALAKDIPVENVNDADFLRLLPALNAIADTTAGFREPPLFHVSFGLSQYDKVAGTQSRAYSRALNSLLLPRLLVHLQNRLRSDRLGVDETFDALKLYGMLGGIGPMDPEAASAAARLIFEELYPGEGRREVRERLTGHVAALVGRPVDALNIDNELFFTASRRIARQSEAERAFHLLSTSPQATALPVWSASSVIGSASEPAFARRSGGDLREGVPGIYTRSGFLKVVAPGLAAIARQVAGEYWIRGRSPGDSVPADAIARETIKLYFAAFEKNWSAYLNDLTVRQSDAAMTEIASILASKSQPLVALAKSVAESTDLPGALAGGYFGGAAAWIAPGSVPDPYEKLRNALNEKAGGDKEGSRIEVVQPMIGKLHDQLVRQSLAPESVNNVAGTKNELQAAKDALVAEVRGLPSPMKEWIAELAAAVEGQEVNTLRSRADRVWQAGGAKICAAAIADRYPFNRKADREVAMDDFIHVFGPKGVFDSFFTENLAASVDTTATPWRWKGAFGATGAASEALAQFYRANQIRQAFFNNGSQPSMRLTIKPETLDEGATSVILVVFGDARVINFHGPVAARTFMWTAQEKSSMSRLIFQPGGWEDPVDFSGPWSMLRLFDIAQKTKLSADSFRARFSHAGHTADFEVQVGSILNPFTSDLLTAFICPNRL
ncbi:MAG: type VI secretion system membrane subunit TssM [Alphaproteobacteria bacterium]|nr:type VI secretion system membrane subunit TssM [Alphaproteobacteria bacterium]